MLALLCSGQGTQHRDMFRLTGAAPEAAAIFAAATSVLGSDPRGFVQSTDPPSLTANRAAQILCVTQALAAAAMLSEAMTAPYLVAGYSVGALGAWGVAGMLAPETAIGLAAARAELMDQASGPDDGLAFIRGLALPEVRRLATVHQAAIAIINPSDSTILGGARPQLHCLVQAALAAGATRAGLLPVRVASHTQRLQAASTAFDHVLRRCDMHPPVHGTTLLSALDGAAVREPQQAIGALAREICTTLHWTDCLQALIERGATAFFELGPGRALAEMAGTTAAGPDARSIEDFNSRDGLLAWVHRRTT